MTEEDDDKKALVKFSEFQEGHPSEKSVRKRKPAGHQDDDEVMIEE